MTAAHERPEFRNSVSWTVAITFAVAGGARRDTARFRAEKLAARIVSAAARLAGVVEVRAVGGETSVAEDFKPLWPRIVAFDAANTGQARYLDPDRERALASLAEANAAYQARQRADESRRREVGCANVYRSPLSGPRRCECVYCAPAYFLSHWTNPDPVDWPRCLCGPLPALTARRRCPSHTTVRIVPLEGDPPTVVEAARLDPLTSERGAS